MLESFLLPFGIVIGVFLLLFPSLVIIRILAPKFSVYEQVLVSVPLSISMLAIFVTYINLMNINFDFFNYLIFVIPFIVGYTVYYIYFKKGTVNLKSIFENFKIEKDNLGYFFLVILSILVIVAILLTGFQGFLVPPHNDDASVHNRFISLIFNEKNVFQVFNYSIYPYGYHVTVALLMGIIPIPGYRLSLYVIILITSLFPAALFFFIKKTYNNNKIASFTAILSVGFFLFPFAPYGWGGYPLILGMFFVPFVVAISYLSIKEDDIKLAILSGILVTGTFFVHPSEIIPECIFLLVIIPFLLPLKTYFRSICKNLLVTIAISSALVAMILPHLFSLLQLGHTLENTLGISISIQSAVNRSFILLFDLTHNYFLFVLFLIGLIYILYKRVYLEILVIQIIFFALYMDTSSLQLLKSFYMLTFPWSQYERLLYIQYFFILFISGIGFNYIITYLEQKKRFRLNKFTNFIFVGGIVLCLSSGSIFMTTANIHTMSVNNVAVTQNDMIVMNWIGNNIPSNETILNEYGNDGGVWISSVSNREVLLPIGAPAGPNFTDKLYLANHISEVPYNQKAAELLSQYNITYVYYGEKTLLGRERIFSLSSILSNPHFSILYQRGSAYLLKYTAFPGNFRNESQYDIGTSDDASYVISGFYDRERWGENGEFFRWSSAKNIIKGTNLGNYSRIQLRIKAVQSPQTIKVLANNVSLGSVVLNDLNWTIATMNIPPETNDYNLLLEFDVSPTYILPTDARSLGMAFNYMKLMK